MSDSPYLPPYGFAALEPRQSRIETSRFVVLPIPYEQTTTFGAGTRDGPEAILRASRELELWDQELGIGAAEVGIHTRPYLEPCVSGPGDMVERVGAAVTESLQPGKIPVLIGGEHTISIGAVRAIAEKRPEMVVVVLDAHADLRDEYQGSPYSHACTSRRISEVCPIILVGVRSMSRGEADFLRERDWPVFAAARARSDASWMSRVAAETKGRPVYVSIDLDVLDPGIMPSVGTPQPGGLGWYEVLALTQELAGCSEIVGFDVVELSPVPGLLAPDFLAAKLLYKLMGQIAHERGQ